MEMPIRRLIAVVAGMVVIGCFGVVPLANADHAATSSLQVDPDSDLPDDEPVEVAVTGSGMDPDSTVQVQQCSDRPGSGVCLGLDDLAVAPDGTISTTVSVEYLMQGERSCDWSDTDSCLVQTVYTNGPHVGTVAASAEIVFAGHDTRTESTPSFSFEPSFSVEPSGTHPLDVTIDAEATGSGSVSSDPAGIECPEDCSADFGEGTAVTLSATPDPGSTFLGWSGDCEGNEACELTMNEAHSVTAAFEADSEASADLSVTQTDEPDPVTAGNDVRYLVTVANAGPDAATNVTLTDIIPEGSTLVSADDPGCSVDGDIVTCVVGTLAAEGATSISIVVTAPNSTSPTTLTNTASVTADESDPDLDDNTSAEDTSVQPAAADEDVAAGFVDDEGGTVATGGGSGPTKPDPMTSAVTVPPGFEGLVTIVEGPITSCQAGFVCFGQEASITAPTTDADDPLRLSFQYHKSSLPKQTKPNDIVMFHDDVLVPRCTEGGGVAAPDPCVSSVAKIKGNMQVVVFSSSNGRWRGGR